MNFQNYPYYQALLQQASTSSLLNLQKQLQSSQNTLMIPPFSAISNREFFGHKRPNEHLEENSKDEAAPTKKIKVDSYNMLSKSDLSESDPYYSKPNSTESSPSERKSTVSYKQLNDQIATDKRITINFSTKPKPTKTRLPPLKINTTPAEYPQALPLAKSYAHVNTHNRVCVKDKRVPLYDLICKKLEENCYTLMNQMRGLVVLSQDLRNEKLAVPQLNFNLAETQPGTPNSATNGSLYEIRFNLMKEGKENEGKRNSSEDVSPKSF